MIRFQCPLCRNPISLPVEYAGQKVPCPNCGQRLQVPQAPPGLAKTMLGETLPARVPQAPPPQVIETNVIPQMPMGPTVVVVNAPQAQTDAFGIVSLIFGAIAVVCLLIGCLLSGIPWVIAVPMAAVGAVLGFFAKGNLKVAGLTLNFLALAPAIGLAVIVVGCCGLIGMGSLVPTPESNRTAHVDMPTPRANQAPVADQGRDQPKKDRDKKKREDEERERARAEQAARREKERLHAIRNETRQSLVSRDKDNAGPRPSGKWADAAADDVQQATATIRVSDVQPKDNRIEIRLTVGNISKTRPLEFRPWSAASGDDSPVLISEGGNPFAHVSKPRALVAIAPGDSTPDVLSFQGLLPDGDLRLELPVAVVRGEGKFRFTIPRALIVVWQAANDEKGIASLATLLPDPRITIRLAAARGLAKAGIKARPALGELLAASEDSNAEVKEAVQEALKGIGPLGKDDVPIVAAGLKADAPTARARACRSLGAMGVNAAPAVKDLASALGDKDADVRAEAAAALGKVGADANTVSAAVIQATKDPEAKVRMNALGTLGKIDAGEEGTPALLAAMNDKDDVVATVAGKVLQDSGKITKKHIPDLVALVKSNNPESRRFAVGILAPMAAKSPDALAAINEAIKDETPGVRLAAISALGAAGSSAAKSVPAMRKLLADDNREVRKATMEALGKIGPKAWEATPTLVGLLKDKESADDARAALLKIGSGSVDAIIAALEKKKDFKERITLIGLLGEIGPNAADAVKPLREMLSENPTPGLRRAIVEALAKIEKKKK